MVCEKKIVSLKERESLTILFFGLEVVDFIRRLIYSELILTRDNFCQVVTDKKLQDLESCHNLIVTLTASQSHNCICYIDQSYVRQYLLFRC